MLSSTSVASTTDLTKKFFLLPIGSLYKYLSQRKSARTENTGNKVGDCVYQGLRISCLYDGSASSFNVLHFMGVIAVNERIVIDIFSCFCLVLKLHSAQLKKIMRNIPHIMGNLKGSYSFVDPFSNPRSDLTFMT